MSFEANTQSPPFALGTYSEKNGVPFAGVLLGGDVVPLARLGDALEKHGCPVHPTMSVVDTLNGWPQYFPALKAISMNWNAGSGQCMRQYLLPVDQLRILPPVNLPRQVFCAGANYFKHVVDILVDQRPGELPGTEHMDKAQLRSFAVDLMTKRQQNGEPYFFNKPVSTVTGACDPIVLPSLARKPDWELELGVIIGRPVRRVSRADAMNYVAGYTIVNDITDRTLLWRRDDMKQMGTDWVAGKSAPTYLPMGPFMLPAAFVPDPSKLQLTLRLNGEVKQNESTADMIFDIPRLIEYLSSMVQLWPGDLICTGSPAGNGTHYNRFLQPGDVVESAISGLGTQRNTVVAEIS
jgi:2-keto-4-pentenoate hydratase/2-oxohepta-3-ene-1,7-dioic acid hydratase in catechol pathway